MSDDNKLKIRFRVGDREYSMSIGRDNPTEEYNVRKAAKMVTEKYATYLTRQGLEPIDCYALLALEMSIKNIELETRSEDDKTLERKLDELARQIDEALDGSAE